jgi:putative aldouronate transport system substrate-binding protein
MTESLVQGRASVDFGSVWDSWWPLPLCLDNNPNADWLPVPLPQGGTESAKLAGDKVTVQGILVTCKGNKHPEALVKMSNLFMDLNEDPEKMEFSRYNTDPIDNTQIFLAYPLVIHNPAFNLDALRDITAAQNSGDLSQLCEAFRMFYDQAMAYRNTKDISGWPSYRSYLKDETSLAVVYDYMQKDMVVYNEYTQEPTLFMIENEPTVKKLFDTMAVGVISGQLDIKEYDSFIVQWDSIYGNTATKEVNDWYKTK